MRKLAFLLAVAGVSAAALAAGSRATLPVGNVLQNPGGEADITVPVSPPSGWSTDTGAATTLNYTVGGGFPSPTDPGCPDRGNNFFYGGDVSPSAAHQDVDVSGAATEIDAGGVYAHLGGYLGGYDGQDDNMVVTVAFLDGSMSPVGSPFQIGPVLSSDRAGTTELLLRPNQALVPATTRTLRVTQTATRASGSSNDGYGDCYDLHLDTTPTAVVLRSFVAASTARSVVIRWNTAAETGILGFEVYRGRATARVRLSRTLLPAVFGGSAGGHAYAFRDIHGRPGSRYWIRVVRLGGSASWVGPARAG